MNALMTVEQAVKWIEQGRPLMIAGEAEALSRLPKGCWLGGTIPYFMTDEGGVQAKDRIFVTAFPDAVRGGTVKAYAPDELASIPREYPAHGLSMIIIPANSEALIRYARENAQWPGLFDRPLLGWVAGVSLDTPGVGISLVFDGTTGLAHTNRAGVLHLELDPDFDARVEAINLFTEADGDVLTFPSDGFVATECFVNGKRRSLTEYLSSKQVDTRWPLVADYSGAKLNVSFQSIDVKERSVTFYAPVFAGVEYRLARPHGDYVGDLRQEIARRDAQAIFTCNCILNYQYAQLEGRKLGHTAGPFTFGEIAWMLLNQTVVYFTLERTRAG